MDIRDELGALTDRNKKTPKSKFLLSTIALVYGWLSLLASCTLIVTRAEDPTAEAPNDPLLGLQIILGTLAYRSLKRTKLGIREKSVLRRVGELLALTLVWVAVFLLLGNNLEGHELTPVYALWSYIAYLVIVLKQPHMSTVDEEPRGLGGWLILVAIGLCITPIELTVSVVNDLLPIFQLEGYWDLLTTPGSEVYHRLWGPLIIFAIVGNTFIIIFSIILIFLFFTKSHRFPILAIVFVALNFVLVVSDFFLADLLPVMASEDDGEFVIGLFQAIFNVMAWIPYLLSSKRVKNTFVKQDSDRPLQSS